MRKAFFALDEDRSGSIEIDELGGVLQKWINLELTEEQLEIIKVQTLKCNPQDIWTRNILKI
jgi:hypothetical protein